MTVIKNLFIPTKENKQKPYLLSKVAIAFYTFVLVFVNSFGGLIGISEVQASSITPQNIIALTNQERVAYGLNTLNTNAQLSAAALAKANDMFEKQYWDHFGPNGESPWQFIRAAGYNYVYAGENLAKGFRTAEGIHEAWMASPTHKANIISGNYKDIGVAVVDGELLGKQTTLVVQMFGNLTNEVHGTTQTPPQEQSTTPAPAPAPSSTEKVVVKREVGEIKSIRITSPREGSTITDPSSKVKGETENVNNQYIVEIYEQDGLIGDTTSNASEWEFSKDSDWAEGEHSIFAKIKGEEVKSEGVTFTVDSRAPVVDKKTLQVQRSEGFYVVTFEIEGEWEEIQVVVGSEILDLEYEIEDGKVVFRISEEDVKGAVVVILSDEHGNTSEIDISEYFIEEEQTKRRIIPYIGLGTGDKISIAIVSFVLILILIEVFMYWRKGRMKDALGDIFTVGVWWIILAFAIFNGFSGVIN